MIWTPLDLLLTAGSSESALRAERERAATTLRAMRDGLLSVVDQGVGHQLGSAQFSNAASNFFCLVQVTDTTLRSELRRIEKNVETALGELKAKTLEPEAALGLARVIDALTQGIWPQEHGLGNQAP